MKIPRFYTRSALDVDCKVHLSTELTHYILNVLRLSVNQPVVLFNGDGNEYSAEITDIQKRSVTIVVDAVIGLNVESSLNIHLGQSVSKGERMDFALQKSVELGVKEITPVITERCVVKLSKERWARKHAQWSNIIISACEQSGRNVIPTLHQPISIQSWIQQQTNATKLMLNPKSTSYIAGLSKPAYGFNLLVGPEGGLTEQEVYTCEQTGFIGLNLGPRILRTETAALTGIALLQSYFGDL